MKNFTLIILLFLCSLSGFSQGLEENFDTAPAAPVAGGIWTLPSGDWRIFDNGVGTANWRLNTAAFPANSDPNAAFITNQNIGQNSTSEDYLATPLVTMPTNAQLRFHTRMTIAGNQQTVYQIRAASASSDPSLPASYTTILATYSEADLSVPSDVDQYLEKVVQIPASLGPNAYIAFVKIFTQPTASLGGDRWLVDDVRVVPQCLDPINLTATAITQTTANLSWGNPSGATQWEIEIMPLAATPTGSGTIISTNPYLATGLAPSTQYKYYVRALCANNISSAWVGPFNFATSSPGLSCTSPIIVGSTPYSTTDNTSNYADNTDVAQPGTCAGTTTNYMTGNEVFYSYTPTVTGAISITMTPGGTRSGIFVYEGCANVGVTCIAGVANTGSTIREIPSLNVTAGVEYIIVISTASTPQTVPYTLVIQTLNCAAPSGLSATGTGPNSANLSWSANTSTSWEVFVQTAGSPIPSGAGTTTTDNTNFEVTELTGGGGLVLGTPYQYWVRADCGDGTFSTWSGPYLFNTTSCSSGCNYTFVMTDSWGDGWNNNTMNVIQNGLTVATIGATFTAGAGPVSVSVPLCDGPFQLFWNAGGSFAGEVGVSIVNSFGQTIYVKPAGTGAQNTQLFSGIVDCSTPACLPPMTLTSSTPTTDGASLNWVPNGPTPLSWDIYAVPTGSPAPTAATTPTVNIPGTTVLPYVITGLLADTQYTYYVRAVCASGGANDWSSPSTPFTTLPTCPKVTNITLTNPTETSLDINWTPGGSETAWQYIILPSGSPAPTPATTGWVSTTTHPVTITGLTAGTLYNAYVMAVCSPTDSSTVAGPATGNTTICPPADQCLYSFVMVDSFGDGWNGNTMRVTQNGITVAVLTGPTNADNQNPITVTVALCNNLPFTLFWNSGGTFANEVGISIVNSFSQTIYTKPPGTGAQNTSLFTGTVNCLVPECLPPTALTSSTFTTTGASLSWTPNGPLPVSWDIYAVPTGSPAPTAATVPTVTIPGTTVLPYVITGLLADTQYTYYVRSVCSGGGFSPWSVGSSPFTTLPTCPKPTNLALSGATLTSLNLTFTAGGTETSWQYNILPAGSPAPTPASGGWVVTNSTSVTISGLTSGTMYSVYVMAICSPTDSSTVAGPVNGSTLICAPAGLCDYTFVMTDSFGDGWNGNTMTVSQNGITVATLTGPTTNDDQNPVSQTVALCNNTPFQLFWNTGGAFANEVGISIVNAAETIIYTKPPGTGTQNSVLFSGTVSCIPASCPKPVQLFASSFTATTALLSWVEAGTATAWEILVLPTGSPAPTAATPGVPATNPYTATLTPGTSYEFYVRAICSTTDVSNWSGPYDVIPPPISANTTQYTALQLVEDILLNTTCANVSNVTSSTGSNFGSVNGLGYFDQNGSMFPFADGVVLSTGNAANTPGPNTSSLGEGVTAWGGDAGLQAVLTAQGITGTLHNTTKLEFDFVPLTNEISFNFIFASEEYGTFQCGYSDVFAFLLTDLTTGVTTNLAVVPNTNIPISVTTIRDSQFNNGCVSSNAQHFGDYYGNVPGGINPESAPINFNGTTGGYLDTTTPDPTDYTRYLTAYGTVTPGAQYHIKLAIADFNDNSFDSAVFLEGGSFDIGNIELGGDFLEEEGNAVCSDGSVQLESELDPDLYDFVWLQDGQPMAGETGPNLTVTVEGTYTLEANYEGTTCIGTDSIVVEFYDDVAPGTGQTLMACAAGDTGIFNLNDNQVMILSPLSSAYTLTYYETAADAANSTNAISNPSAYTNISNPQTIYVRVEHAEAGCFGFTNFDLMVEDLTPQFTLPADVSFCTGESATISVTPINFVVDDANYNWTFNGMPIQQFGSSITITEGGVYGVTVTTGCSTTMSITAVENTYPVVTAPANVTVCDSYTLPALTATGNYYSQTMGGGQAYNAGDVITQTMTLYVYGANGTCATEESFTITVAPAVADAPANVDECTDYSLPALSAGNAYYTATGGPGGSGTEIPAGTVINTIGVTTIYVYAVNGACTDENMFTVTIGDITADVLAPVVMCDSYILQPLSANNNYYTMAGGPTGGGTLIPAGTVINTSGVNTIYIWAQLGNCDDESTFTVTIYPTPVVPEMGDVNACDSYILPTLATGSYYTGSGGTGTMVPAQTVITQDTTLYIYAENGVAPVICSDEDVFSIFITDSPVVNDVADVTSCGSYSLPAIVGAGSYFTGPDGGGDAMQAGDVITETQTIYVFAQSQNTTGTLMCPVQDSFTVTISSAPEFIVTGGCDGNVYTLEFEVLNNSFEPGAVSYEWSTTNGNIIGSTAGQSATIQGAGMYNLKITSPGCPEVSVPYTVSGTSCIIQKGISPNNDGDNECFRLEGFNVTHLSIFNRYGMKVFEEGAYTDQWCGQNQKGDELPDGTYYYVIERSDAATTTGWIYLTRKN